MITPAQGCDSTLSSAARTGYAVDPEALVHRPLTDNNTGVLDALASAISTAGHGVAKISNAGGACAAVFRTAACTGSATAGACRPRVAAQAFAAASARRPCFAI